MFRSSILVAVGIAAGVVWASAQAQESGSPEGAVEEIVVTGSRISRVDNEADSPIVNTPVSDLTKTANVNVESVLSELPQFVPGQGAYTVQSGGRATLNLRGLGEQRNLILLDGRRLPPSNALGVVDVDIIPLSILEGVDVISGGASATYGSDAISGVVNFKSRKQFEGIEVDAQYGNTFGSDLPQANISLAGGMKSEDGRSHALLALGYTYRGSLVGQERDFFRDGGGSSYLGQSTYIPNGANLPSQAAVDAVFGKYGVAPGAVARTRNLGFNNDGTLFSQTGPLNYQGPGEPLWSTAGGILRQPSLVQNGVLANQRRYSAFGKFDHEITEHVKAYAQVLYVEDEVAGSAGWNPSIFAVPSVPVTNPFVPADLSAILASRPNPAAPFTLNTRFMGLPQKIYDEQYDTNQFLVGLNGDIPGTSLNWDVYGSKGTSLTHETLQNAVLLSRLQPLLNAADGGASICEGGYNPFGLANNTSISQSCEAQLAHDVHNETRVTQDVIEGTLKGSLFEIGQQEVKFAVTGDYRKDTFRYSPDAAVTAGDVMATVASPASRGATSVKEGSAEVLVPVLRNLPFVRSLDVSAGVRYSDYDIVGGHPTYKFGVEWKPVSALLIRGGYERATRAPNLAELFSSATGSLTTFGLPPSGGDPCDVRSLARTGANANSVRSLCAASGVPAALLDSYVFPTNAITSQSSGSTALEPETADTYTAGLVWRPAFEQPLLSTLSFSVDWYDIKVDKVISTVSAITALSKCYNLDGSNPGYSVDNVFCQQVVRDPSNGQILVTKTPYLNLGGLKTRGVDIEANWGFGLGAVGLDDRFGRLALRSLVNFLGSYEVATVPGSAFQEFKGTIDGTLATGLVLPKWRSRTSLDYTVGPANLGLTWRHIPSMHDVTSVTRPTSPAPGTESYDEVDMSVGWSVNPHLELRGGISNLFDRQPVEIAGTPGLTQAGTYDIVGRSFFVSVKSRL
jgi:iron complex outermembrane recepter protein